MAAAFPAEMTDMFVVAFTIPNALRGLLAEGAVSGALMPTYAEKRNAQGEEVAREFYSRFSGAMIILLALTTVLGVLAAPALVYLYAAGYADDPARFASTVSLTRYVFPYIFFMGLAALGMGALNLNKRFAVPALAPALLNVSQVLAPFVFTAPAIALGLPPVGALVLGALVGGLLQVVVQWPALARVGMLLRPRFALGDPAVREALGRMAPLTFGLGVYQVNVMLSRNLASGLVEGSQSYLNYGQRLVEIPQGMFAVAIASAALPTLADLRARGKLDELKRTFTYALRSALFVALPATDVPRQQGHAHTRAGERREPHRVRRARQGAPLASGPRRDRCGGRRRGRCAVRPAAGAAPLSPGRARPLASARERGAHHRLLAAGSGRRLGGLSAGRLVAGRQRPAQRRRALARPRLGCSRVPRGSGAHARARAHRAVERGPPTAPLNSTQGSGCHASLRHSTTPGNNSRYARQVSATVTSP